MELSSIYQTKELTPQTTPLLVEDSLKEKIAAATVEWITALMHSCNEGQRNYPQNNGLVRTGVWYPNSHRLALNTLGAKAKQLNAFIQQKDGHICGYAPSKYFTYIPDQSREGFNNKRVMHFLLNDNVLPSDAIRAARVGLSIIDCGVACQISRYGALLNVLGERKFNILFGNSSKGQKMNIGYLIDDHLQPMQYFVQPTDATIASAARKEFNKPPREGEIGNRHVCKGDLLQIKGVATHRYKHPWKEDADENLICSDSTPGQQRFISLDSDGTEAQIYDQLVVNYNRMFDWAEIHPNFKNPQTEYYVALFKDHKVLNLDPAKGEGINTTSIQEYNLSLIQDLVNLPEDQISMDYVKSHKSLDLTARQEKIIEEVRKE